MLFSFSLLFLVLSMAAGGAVTVTIPAWLLSVELWGCVVLVLLLLLVLHPAVPAVKVELAPGERYDVAPSLDPPTPKELADPKRREHTVDCWNPATGEYLGAVHVCTPDEVKERVRRARVAQQQWAKTSFAERRQLLRILSRCTLDYADEICRASARDSGKPMLDAAMGELITTLEKNAWLIAEGERWLKPEARAPGRMFFLKRAWVEWHPRGVLGAIVCAAATAKGPRTAAHRPTQACTAARPESSPVRAQPVELPVPQRAQPHRRRDPLGQRHRGGGRW